MVRPEVVALSEAAAGVVDRIRLDIADFDLPSYIAHTCHAGEAARTGLVACVTAGASFSVPAGPAVVAFGKHLCGAATDLALRCLARLAHVEGVGAARLRGVAIATCCHHVCSWRHYTGRDWFAACGLGAREFELMRLLSSWCLTPPSDLGGLDGAALGRQCKRLIDAGRVAFLNGDAAKGGPHARARLLSYCRVEESPENCLLLGGAW